MEREGATLIEEAKLLDHLSPKQLEALFEENFQRQHVCTDPCSNTNSISSSASVLEAPPRVCREKPTKLSLVEAAAASSDLVCQHNSNSKNNHHQGDGCSVGSVKHKSKVDSGSKDTGSCSRRPSYSKEGPMAKWKGSAKVNQQFRALTAIVPCIEKMDESAVVEETIEYLKQLQERVKTLEEKISMKKLKSVVFDKKLQNHSDSASCSSDENFTDDPLPLPQIEARVSDRNVLIRICCEMRKGVLVKTLEDTEKVILCVVNSSSIPFQASTLEIIVLAQMDDEYKVTVKDLVKSLRSSLIQFMGKNPLQENNN